jgi:hypothetical protein
VIIATPIDNTDIGILIGMHVASTANSCACSSSSPTREPTTISRLGYHPHKQEVCHRRSVFFQQHRCTIGLACAQAVALRGAPTTARRHVAAPCNLPPLNMAYDEYGNDERHVDGVA